MQDNNNPYESPRFTSRDEIPWRVTFGFTVLSFLNTLLSIAFGSLATYLILSWLDASIPRRDHSPPHARAFVMLIFAIIIFGGATAISYVLGMRALVRYQCRKLEAMDERRRQSEI